MIDESLTRRKVYSQNQITFKSEEKKKDSRNLTNIYIKMILYNLGLKYGFIFIDYTQKCFLQSENP